LRRARRFTRQDVFRNAEQTSAKQENPKAHRSNEKVISHGRVSWQTR
jgi:hypothetical protein